MQSTGAVSLYFSLPIRNTFGLPLCTMLPLGSLFVLGQIELDLPVTTLKGRDRYETPRFQGWQYPPSGRRSKRCSVPWRICSIQQAFGGTLCQENVIATQLWIEQTGHHMKCANPQCRKELIYLREGRLEAHELEIPYRERLPLDNGFPTNPVPTKFFWLCGTCVKTHSIKRWTNSGLVVEFSAVKFGPTRTLVGGESDPVGTTTMLSA
jgi:hypothetical protein